MPPLSTHMFEVPNSTLLSSASFVQAALTYLCDTGISRLDRSSPLIYEEWEKLEEMAFRLGQETPGREWSQLICYRVMERGIEGLLHLIASTTYDQYPWTGRAAQLQMSISQHWASQNEAHKWLIAITGRLESGFTPEQTVKLAKLSMDACVAFQRKYIELRRDISEDTSNTSQLWLRIVHARYPHDEAAREQWKSETLAATRCK